MFKRSDEAEFWRYTAHPNGYHAAVRLSEDYALRARTEVDIDEPNIDTLQSLLLLSVAFTAAGKGKKAYMMLGASHVPNSGKPMLTLNSEWCRYGSCT
jgi:hypothetical protein